MPEYEDVHFGNNESTHSLDNEFGAYDVPIMRTHGVKKAIAITNEKLRRSTRERNRLANSVTTTTWNITIPLR